MAKRYDLTNYLDSFRIILESFRFHKPARYFFATRYTKLALTLKFEGSQVSWLSWDASNECLGKSAERRRSVGGTSAECRRNGEVKRR